MHPDNLTLLKMTSLNKKPNLLRDCTGFGASKLQDLVSELDQTPSEYTLKRIFSIPLEKQILLHLIFCHPGDKRCGLSHIIALLKSVDAILDVSRESYDKAPVLKEIIGSLRFIGLEDDGGGERYDCLGDDFDIEEITGSLRYVDSEEDAGGKELYLMWCGEASASAGQRRSRFGKNTNSDQYVKIAQIVRRCIRESPPSYELC